LIDGIVRRAHDPERAKGGPLGAVCVLCENAAVSEHAGDSQPSTEERMPVLAFAASVMLAILFATPATASAANGPIAFQSSAGVNLINLDGSGATLLVRSQGEDGSGDEDEGGGEGGETVTPAFPEMAPGGHRVAYVSIQRRMRVERRSTIFVKQTGFPKRQLLRPGKKVFSSTAAIEELAFSPDGRRIAFVMVDRDGDRELYSIREDGRGPRKLTDNHRDEFAPTWSPNGKRIAFSRVTDRKHPHVGGRTADIFTISARNGSRQQRLTSGSTFEAYPSYSPDGKRIAFESRPIARGPKGDPNRIWVMWSDGSHRRQITHAPGGQGHPSFSPDGRWIAYSTYGEPHLEAVRLRDSATQFLADDGFNPSW
jgi:dipeptidyl aminopeptidase/acylaminoacyl peptidase